MWNHNDILIEARETGRDPHGLMAERAVETGLAPEVATGMRRLQPAMPLWELVRAVAARWSVTADPETPAYVGVRPQVHGAISGYVNKAFVDLRLHPERARSLCLAHGWKLVQLNGSTGTVRVHASTLEAPDAAARVVELFVEALEKSETGPPFEGGGVQHSQLAVARPICPTHGTEMLGGVCDRCD